MDIKKILQDRREAGEEYPTLEVGDDLWALDMAGEPVTIIQGSIIE